MGTYSHNCKSTYNLLGGLGELLGAVIIGVISTLNLQVRFRSLLWRSSLKMCNTPPRS